MSSILEGPGRRRLIKADACVNACEPDAIIFGHMGVKYLQ